MPTPAFCSLDEVYSDWNFKKPASQPNLSSNQQSNQQLSTKESIHQHPQLHPAQQISQNGPFEKDQEQEDDTTYIPNNNGLRSFCPNCQNCVKANDVLQQRIIEQNIWPRPRWEPQYPNAYAPYDPFNRYWMNNVPQSHREDFGNVFENFGKGNRNGNMSTETLLQVILFILIALFIIQLIECLYMRCTGE